MRSAIVLVGGLAERAGGMEKYFFRYRGRTFIDTMIYTLSGILDDIVLVARDKEQCRRFSHIKGVRCVADIRRGIGPIGGLHAGVQYIRGDTVFVSACDMPLIKKEVILHLFSLIESYDAVVPCWDKDRLEPLHAVYRRDALMRYLDQGGEPLSLRGMVQTLNTRFVGVNEIRTVDPELTSFININRLEELEAIGGTQGSD
ncbi:MAG: molybdenum cofactor guanylyltransferase [Methanomicrobiales archaeon]|nr:molybdenum cofactor guanylyltransferase [Methanomicrobiales archaeon]